VSQQLPQGYWLREGGRHDRPQLLQFLKSSYRELFGDRDLSHLRQTVEQYWSPQTPVWWVESPRDRSREGDRPDNAIVAGLWLGNALDQVTGDRYAHIFLVYVVETHRQRGIGSALIRHAEHWARQRGDRQIGLQVFIDNPPALNLYRKLGYRSQSLWMLKPLDRPEASTPHPTDRSSQGDC
jgi:ribosomal protein S18 acetylase RimI-like enzyme